MNDIVPPSSHSEVETAALHGLSVRLPSIVPGAGAVASVLCGHLPQPVNLSSILLDLLPVGILVIDERRNMLLANRVAEEIVASGNPLCAGRDGTVRVRDRARQTAFSTFVRSVCSNSVNEGRHNVHLILREKGAPPITVTAARCDHCMSSGKDGQTLVLMCLRDSLRSPQPNRDTLRVLFGFTAAESALAEALLTGQTLRAHAERRGVGLNTVRTQLKAVLGKTGLHRQADLVRVLGTM